MSKKLKCITLAFVFISCFVWAQESSFNRSQIESFDKAMTNGISLGIPGISVAIGKADSIYWSGTAGFSNLRKEMPVTKNTKFGIGSITKTFVAIVILQLANEGKLNINHVATDYLDERKLPEIANLGQAPIRSLLNHQSGIPSWEFDEKWIPQGRGEKLRPDHIWKKKETLAYIDTQQADFEPGHTYEYSNTNYTLLGLIIEKVTGNSLHEEIRNRILTPLDLDHTFMESQETIPDGYTANYHYATPEFIKTAGVSVHFKNINTYLIDTSNSNLSTEWAAGGMVSNAEDLVKWAQALKGNHFIDDTLKKVFFTYHPPKEGRNEIFQYSQGIYTINKYTRNHSVVGHSGGTLGFSAMMFWIKDTDIVVVALTNVGHMHSGLKRPPFSLFYQSILLPTVLEHFDLEKK